MLHKLRTPLNKQNVRQLKIGDQFYLSGTLVTARDEAHKKALEIHEKGVELPFELKDGAIFHAGPIMQKVDDGWKLVAVGPTTSSRMEIFEDLFIKAFRPSIIIGKGGMGDRTSKACAKYGCVYGAFTGGAALLGARGIKRVKDVFWLEELGTPECLWILEAEGFGPMLVTIDANGDNLTKKVMRKVAEKRDKIIASLK